MILTAAFGDCFHFGRPAVLFLCPPPPPPSSPNSVYPAPSLHATLSG